MPTARKLPSGSWRCQVFSHYEYAKGKDGEIHKKRIYESFTSDDPTAAGKKEAERMAAEWASTGKYRRCDDITVFEAVERYIAMKESVLSPSTIAGYKKMLRNYFSSISALSLRKIDSTTVQIWITKLAISLSPKTVRNIYTLFSSVMEMFRPESRIKVTLPAKTKPNLYTPNDQDIKTLLAHIQGKELEIAVLLAAFGPMRRGEICALESSDVHDQTVTVSRSMVLDDDKNWVVKSPKTYESYRDIIYPDFVIDKIKNIKGRIVNATPDQITNRFRRALKYSGLPHFRFHDLRHYAASIMHAIGVPDQYIMARGGWKTDNVMKSVYRNVIDLEAEKQNRKINKHFQAMQHDMQHGS